MKIGIDISQIVYKGTGVARFTEGLVNTILKYNQKNSWTFLFYSFRQNLDQELEKKIIKKDCKLIKWKLPSTFVSFASNNLHSLTKLLTFKFELLTSLDWFITSDWTEIPLTKVNKATIVHDLVFKRYPETVNQKILKTQELRLNHVKKESKVIFVDSQVTKKDLNDFYKIDSKNIVVNYPGVEVNKPSKDEIEKTLTKYKISKPFILTVGKIEPRKNLGNLIEAFKKIDNSDLNLVIVGPKGWDLKNIKHPLQGKQISNIKYLGFVMDQELYSLYSTCQAFVFPSLWEGFGYPLVEAMNLNTPVVCSKIPPFEEIAQKAACYFDPLNIDEILQTINKVLADDQLKKKLVESGKIRAVNFNWQKYYQKLINTLYDYRS